MPRSSRKPQAEKREQKSPAKVVAEPQVTEEETVPSGQTDILLSDVSSQEETDVTVAEIKEEPEDVLEVCLSASDVQQVEQLWIFTHLS